VPLTILLSATIHVAGPLCPCALAQQPADSANKSWTDSVTAPFKQGFDKLGRALKPTPAAAAHTPEDEAVSLKSKAKVGPELYLAIARVYQQAGKPAEAEQQYRTALKEFPDDLPVLLSYAQLKDNLGQLDEAIEIYQRAAKAHPQQAAIYNNLGLCYARQNRLDEAVAAMSRAIQFDGKNPLYRNNIATVLVDQGNSREAFANLRAVHSPGAAYYNMGYLLQKKGQTQAALQHFTLALRADPSLAAARSWTEYLQRSTTQARLPQHPAAAGLPVTSPPATAELDSPLSSDELAPGDCPPPHCPSRRWMVRRCRAFPTGARPPRPRRCPQGLRILRFGRCRGELRTLMNAESLRFPFSIHRSAAIVDPSPSRAPAGRFQRCRRRPGLLIVRVDNRLPRLRVPPHVGTFRRCWLWVQTRSAPWVLPRQRSCRQTIALAGALCTSRHLTPAGSIAAGAYEASGGTTLSSSLPEASD